MAKCQHEMLKQAGKIENTVLKEINKAKKQAHQGRGGQQRFGA